MNVEQQLESTGRPRVHAQSQRSRRPSRSALPHVTEPRTHPVTRLLASATGAQKRKEW